MYEHRSAGMFSDRETSFSDERNQVIRSLKPAALHEFQKLDRDSQEALLYFSEEIARNQLVSEASPNIGMNSSDFNSIESKTSDNHSAIMKNKHIRPRGASLAKSKRFAQLQAKALSKLLLDSGATGDSNSDTTAATLKNSANTSTSAGRSLIRTSRSITNTSSSIKGIISAGKAKRSSALAKKLGIRKLRKARAMSKHSAKATKKISKISKKTAKKLFKTFGKMFSAMHAPLLLIFLLVFAIFGSLVGIVGAVISAFSGAAGNDGAGAYVADVSELVRSYEPQVREACEKHGIREYVELALAMIQQESSGNPPDVMQAEQSPYNKKPPINSVEESIDCGIQELRDCLKAAKVQSPSDIQNISLALQGYNYGNGYIAYALNHDGGYTAENAKAFSEMMKAKYGYRIYGDPDYVPHVLRYYKPVTGAAISNESAMRILKELMENNEADSKTWNLIRLGASLIGKTSYSMEKRQDDGRDNPTILDCSSFTAWCFCKAKYSGISYHWTTTEFRDSKKFKDISVSELKPGDIGLASKTGGNMGNNHVGIYCGKLKDGRKVWMHCTSNSGSSLTGNREGAMFGAYTGFTYFRRYTG